MVTAFESVSTSPLDDRITVRRASELGDEVWTVEIFAPQPLLSAGLRDLDVGPTGEVALLWSVVGNGTCEVVLLAPDGTQRWREQIGSPQAGLTKRAIDVEFDTAGNVYVTTFDDNVAFAVPDELDVRMLDGGTGDLLWTYRQPTATGSFANFVQAQSSGGDLFVTWFGATQRVARLDPTGAEVYAVPVTLAGPSAALAVDGSQSVLLSSLSTYVVLDVAGVATPLASAPSPPLIMEAEGLTGGGFALRHGCCWVSRLDSSGVPLWTHLSDGIGDTYEELVGESGGPSSCAGAALGPSRRF